MEHRCEIKSERPRRFPKQSGNWLFIETCQCGTVAECRTIESLSPGHTLHLDGSIRRDGHCVRMNARISSGVTLPSLLASTPSKMRL